MILSIIIIYSWHIIIFLFSEHFMKKYQIKNQWKVKTMTSSAGPKQAKDMLCSKAHSWLRGGTLPVYSGEDMPIEPVGLQDKLSST